MYILRTLTIIVLSLISIVFADIIYADTGIQCNKIVIAGDSQWPPYTVVVKNSQTETEDTVELKGLGIDLAKRIFNELDVPIIEFAYHDTATMMQGLRDGEIDILVSTYDVSGMSQDVLLMQPAYTIDPITIAIDRDNLQKIKNWDSLSGLKGVQPLAFLPDDQTAEFISRHLDTHAHESLLAALQSVKNGTYKYIIGSDSQLSYAIQNANLSKDLIVMKNIIKGGEVYMAFAKKSSCKQYAIYMQKRLQDYKNNGTVEKVLNKYIHQ